MENIKLKCEIKFHIVIDTGFDAVYNDLLPSIKILFILSWILVTLKLVQGTYINSWSPFNPSINYKLYSFNFFLVINFETSIKEFCVFYFFMIN